MPYNFGRMTSGESSKNLKNFCFPEAYANTANVIAASKDKWQKLRDEIWQLHSEGCAALHPLIVLSFMDIFEKEEQSSR